MAEFDPEPKITECSICHDLYTEPKILPCAHLLCRDCLVSWIKTNKQALCPICRAAIIDEHGCKYASFEEIADGLPTDLAMVELINCKKILSESHVCCAHVSVVASSLCLHCGDMMCQSCGDVHARFTSSRHHTVLELSTLTPEIMVSSKHTPCSSHSDEPSKLYCTVHEVPICLWCSSSNHRSCPEVTSLEEMMKIIKQKLMSMEEKLKRTEYSYDQKIHELEELLKILEENTATAYKAIDNAFNRLQSSVEKCRVRLKDRVKDADLKAKAKLKNKSSDLQSKCGIITSHRLLIQRVRESFPCSSMNAIITLLNTRMHNLDLDAVLSTNDESPRVNTFEVDEDKIVFIEEYLTNSTMIQELETHDSKENHATEESFQQQKESLDSQEVSLYSHTTDFASITANVFGKDGIGDVEAVENKRSHVLGGNSLQVSPHITSLSSVNTSNSSETTPPTKERSVLSNTFDVSHNMVPPKDQENTNTLPTSSQHTFRYIIKTPVIESIKDDSLVNKELVDILQAVNCRYTWTENSDGILVTYVQTVPPQNWKIEVVKMLDKFILSNRVKRREGTIAVKLEQQLPAGQQPYNWPLLHIPRISKVMQRSNVHVQERISDDRDKCEVGIVEPEMSERKDAIQKASRTLASNLARNTSVISTSVPYSECFIKLKNHQMKFLSHPKAMSKLKAQYPYVDIYLDETAGTLILKAPENVQIIAKSNIFSFIVRISEKQIPLLPAHIATYRRKDSQEYVNKVLDEEKLICHWEVSDTCILLSAVEDDHDKICQFFPNGLLVETELHKKATIVKVNEFEKWSW